MDVMSLRVSIRVPGCDGGGEKMKRKWEGQVSMWDKLSISGFKKNGHLEGLMKTSAQTKGSC